MRVELDVRHVTATFRHDFSRADAFDCKATQCIFFMTKRIKIPVVPIVNQPLRRDFSPAVIVVAASMVINVQAVPLQQCTCHSPNLFWQLCERQFQSLVNACDSAEQVRTLRPVFAGFVHKAYDSYCPNDTARQLDAWAKNRPNLSNYLKNPNKEAA